MHSTTLSQRRPADWKRHQVLAVAGVYLLTDVRLAGQPIGFVFAFADAGLFACHIVLGHRIAGRGVAAGIEGLAAATIVSIMVLGRCRPGSRSSG